MAEVGQGMSERRSSVGSVLSKNSWTNICACLIAIAGAFCYFAATALHVDLYALLNGPGNNDSPIKTDEISRGAVIFSREVTYVAWGVSGHVNASCSTARDAYGTASCAAHWGDTIEVALNVQ